VTNDHNGLVLDVFLRDLTSGTTTLVSVNRDGGSGGNNHSVMPMLSANGQLVAFESRASNLVANDTNNATDVFARDLASGTTMLVSVDQAGGGSGRGASSSPMLTPDGRFVFFESTAADLVANDTNNASDVFVRDLQLGTTTLISVRSNGVFSANGASTRPIPSSDGKVVLFSSAANDLVVNSTSNTNNLYLRNLETGLTTLINIVPPNLSNVTVKSYNPVLSADGAFAAFQAEPPRTVTNILREGIYWCDLAAGTNVLVGGTNIITRRASGLSDLSGPVMSADGQTLAFGGFATNLGVGVFRGVYVWKAATDELQQAGFAREGTSSCINRNPVTNADGTKVAFASNATNLVSGDTAGSPQLYVRDLLDGTVQLASLNTGGQLSTGPGFDDAAPSFSADGRVLAFQSRATDLVANDHNRAADVFARDTVSDTTQLVSRRDPALPSSLANAFTSLGVESVSSDGRFVAFSSEADNLVVNDANGLRDVFVRDMTLGSNLLVSVNADGTATGSGLSRWPILSANGRFVAFVSGAANLVANDTNRWDDVFLLDLQAGTTTLLSVSNNGTGTPVPPAISADGGKVAYKDLNRIFAWDTTAGTNVLASADTNSLAVNGDLPAISPNGRFVSFLVQTPHQLFLRDLALENTRLVATSVTSLTPVFSRNGRLLLYCVGASADLYAYDLVADTSFLVGLTRPAGPGSLVRPDPVTSADGRYVAFVSSDPAATSLDDTNQSGDILVRDLGLAANQLASLNYLGTGSGNGGSDSPQLSADGRFVVFRSHASDLVPNDTNGLPDVFLRDLRAGTTALLSQNAAGPGAGNEKSGRPIMSADGRSVFFRSLADDLVVMDYNLAQDLFYFRNTIPETDSDGDGMDDAWELTWFTDLSHDGSADTDGDGLSDLAEFRAGTVPTDPNSVFYGELVGPPGNGQVLVQWSSVPGRVYRLQFKNTLADGSWTDLPGDVTAVGAQAVKVDATFGTLEQRYYRVLLVR